MVLLDRSHPAKRAAWDDVEARVKLTVPGVQVLSVSVLQDPLKWRAYHTKKGNLERKLAGGANERRAFHAGAEASVASIATNGFLREYNTVSQYGKGTYFARDAAYSAADRYSPANANGEKFMFLARVLLGEPCVGNQGMTQPDAKPGCSELHDSIVDATQDPRIMVLSAGSDEHAYAEFLVKFKL
jgi:poly [ADP-ribose] polymerase 10/14/15